VGGDAVGQGEEGLQPVLAAPAEGGDLLEVIDATEGDHDDVDQQVQLAVVEAGVAETGEIALNRDRRRCHSSPP
jgi:hypothetical protein